MIVTVKGRWVFVSCHMVIKMAFAFKSILTNTAFNIAVFGMGGHVLFQFGTFNAKATLRTNDLVYVMYFLFMTSLKVSCFKLFVAKATYVRHLSLSLFVLVLPLCSFCSLFQIISFFARASLINFQKIKKVTYITMFS